MNPILDAMRQRRSVRRYKPEMPARADLEAIAEAGLWAASGHDRQLTRVVIITDPALREKLRVMNTHIGGWAEDFDPFYGAPAILLVLSDRQTPNYIYDGALVMGNMMLAAHALGLGSCWINRAREAFDTEEGKEILRRLGVEGEYEGVGNCIVGYPDGDLPRPKERNEGRVFWAE